MWLLMARQLQAAVGSESALIHHASFLHQQASQGRLSPTMITLSKVGQKMPPKA